MVRRSGSFALFFFALVPALAPAFGQAVAQGASQTSQVVAAAPVDPVMPKDANAAMPLAARVNGLAGIDKPWHLKANYQTFDADGKPKDQGVFEEWWAGPDKYKISYGSTGFNQVEYRDSEKDWIIGDAGMVPVPESLVEQYLVHPLPGAKVLHGQNFAHFDRKMGTNTLACFQPTSFPSDSPPGYVHVDENVSASLRSATVYALGAACFDPKTPMMRIEILEKGNLYVVFDNIAQTKEHYVAEQIWIKNGDSAIVHVSLTGLDFPPSIGDAEIAPPTSAVAVPNDQSAGLAYGRRVGGLDARYPADARKKRLQGTVMLEAIIIKAGDIDNLQIVSGPAEFRKSAYDAVKTWKYKPWLLNGQPVEVRILVDVTYTPER